MTRRAQGQNAAARPAAGACFALLLFALLPLAPQAFAEDVRVPARKADASRRFHLLTIGVGQFKDDFWPALRWTARDAARVGTALGQGTGLAVKRRTLIDEAATRAGVRAALRDVRDAARTNDTVVVYVSSHGTLAEAASGDLEKVVVLSDTRAEDPAGTGLTHAELVRWIEALPARRKLLVFATCHGGVGKSRLPERVEQLLRSTKGAPATLEDVSEGTLILAAAAKGEAAREDDELKGDVYTHYLLEALDTFDRNKDGMVTALEAHDYAKERAYERTKGRQRPTAEARLIGEADVPLRGKRSRRGLPVLEAYDPALAGFQLSVEQSVKGRLPTALPLGEGVTRVELYAPGEGKRVAAFDVRASRGDTVTLADVLAPAPFAAQAELGREVWSDAAFQRLTGSSASDRIELNLALRWRGAELAVGHRLASEGSATVRTALEATLTRTATLAYAGYRWSPRPAWHLGARLGFGREAVALGFEDEASHERERFEHAGGILDYSAQLTYEWGGGIEIALRAGGARAPHDFGALGALSGERQHLGLGIGYAFGGVAQRL